MYPDHAHLSREQLAADVGTSVRTLMNWEKRGWLPRPVKLGTRTVRYLGSDLNAALARMRGASTTEAA